MCPHHFDCQLTNSPLPLSKGCQNPPTQPIWMRPGSSKRPTPRRLRAMGSRRVGTNMTQAMEDAPGADELAKSSKLDLEALGRVRVCVCVCVCVWLKRETHKKAKHCMSFHISGHRSTTRCGACSRGYRESPSQHHQVSTFSLAGNLSFVTRLSRHSHPKGIQWQYSYTNHWMVWSGWTVHTKNKPVQESGSTDLRKSGKRASNLGLY